MSLINKNNYEAFMLDYLEQNLSAELTAELMLFLENHPELKEELEMEIVPLNPEAIQFHDKDELKISAQENLMIASVEGISTKAEEEELALLLAENDELLADYTLYQQTKLAAPEVLFNDYDGLKKKETKVIPLWFWASSAAAILLFFFWLNPFSNSTNNNIKEFVNVTPKNVTAPKTQNSVTPKTEINSAQSDVDSTTIAPRIKNITPADNTDDSKAPIKKIEEKPVVVPIEEAIEPTFENNVAEIEETPMDSILLMPESVVEPILVADNNANTVKSKKPIFTIPQFLRKKTREKLLKQEDADSSKFKGINALEFLARVAGKNAELKKKTNADGELEAYAFNIGRLSFNRKVKK